MCWHSLVIIVCLYLRHVSSRAYETVRSFGCIQLPSQRTLRNYTHYVSASTGFSTEVENQFASAMNIDTCAELEKYVILIVDEMYIRRTWFSVKTVELLLDCESGRSKPVASISEDTRELFINFCCPIGKDNACYDGLWTLFRSGIPLCTVSMQQQHEIYT